MTGSLLDLSTEHAVFSQALHRCQAARLSLVLFPIYHRNSHLCFFYDLSGSRMTV